MRFGHLCVSGQLPSDQPVWGQNLCRPTQLLIEELCNKLFVNTTSVLIFNYQYILAYIAFALYMTIVTYGMSIEVNDIILLGF